MTDDSNIEAPIDGVSQSVLCGLCKAPIASRVETDLDGEYGCSRCDNWAGKDEVLKIAFEYAKDEGQLVINRMAQDAARESKFMTFEGKTTHDKAYRFIVDLQL